ncbi:PPE family protein, SVP subgroup, partial [Mycobacterium marinum]
VPASGIPGMPGMAMTGTGRGGVAPRYGVRLTVMPRPFSGG